MKHSVQENKLKGFAWFAKFLILLFSLNPLGVYALTFSLPTMGNMVGHSQSVETEPGDNFTTIGQRFDVGYYELIEANPGMSPQAPTAWSALVVPTKFVLPPGEHKGIVVNLSELRLYYFLPNQNKVLTFPVGVGREGWGTPLGI